MTKPKTRWYNFRTGKYEDTGEDLRDYIPQSPVAQNMYDLLVQTGTEPLDAALKILMACREAAS